MVYRLEFKQPMASQPAAAVFVVVGGVEVCSVLSARRRPLRFVFRGRQSAGQEARGGVLFNVR